MDIRTLIRQRFYSVVAVAFTILVELAAVSRWSAVAVHILTRLLSRR